MAVAVLGATRTIELASPATLGAPPTPTFAGAVQVSDDGGTVLFFTAENLLPTDSDGQHDLYTRSGGVTTLVTPGTTNQPIFLGATRDLSRIYFHAAEQLTPGDTDNDGDIYEATSSGMTLISDGGTGPSQEPSFEGFSDDGSTVVFSTNQSMDPDDTNGLRDIYKRSAGTTTWVSEPEAGKTRANDGFIDFYAVSQTGDHVVFASSDQLTSDDADSKEDVYEFTGGQVDLVSVPGAGAEATDEDAYFDGMSDDGTKIIFETDQSLLTADTDSVYDIYRRSGGTTTELMSVNGTNPGADDHIGFQDVSADGDTVILSTPQALNDSDDDSVSDLYAGSAGTAATLISVPGAPDPGDTDAAAQFAFASEDATRVYWRSAQKMTADDGDATSDVFATESGTTVLASPGVTFSERITPDGETMAFLSSEQLAGADSDERVDVYTRDVFGATPQTALVSERGTGAVGGDTDAELRGMSDDASTVVFQTDERLLAADTDGQTDIYSHDAGGTTLLSVGSGGSALQLPATFRQLSADGSRLLFSTNQNLVAADSDGLEDLYLRAGGQTSVVYSSNGSGLPSDLSFRIASADLTKVVVDTYMRLAADDDDDENDLYLISAGQATLLTPNTDGGLFFEAASADLSRIVFATEEQVDGVADTDDKPDLYGRANNQTTLLTPGTDHEVFFRWISKDGTKVFFQSDEALTAGSGADNDAEDGFMSIGGVITLATPGGASDQASISAVSDNGSVVAFDTYGQFTTADNDSSSDSYLATNGGQPVLATPSMSNANIDASFRGLTPDGSRLYFTTAEALTSADDDADKTDVYEFSAGTVKLVSRLGSGGTDSHDVEFTGMSGNGLHVYLFTLEPMTGSDTDTDADIYDGSGGQTTLVSANGDGAASSADVFYNGSSSDGSHVFLGTPARLTSADGDGTDDVYERSGGTTTLLSRDALAPSAAPGVGFAANSANGRIVALSTNERLVSLDADTVQDVYVSTLPPPTISGGTTTTTTTTTTTSTPTGTTTTPVTTTTPTPTATTPTPTPTAVVRCVVPKLRGLTLRKAKTKLRRAHCRLGKVTRRKAAARLRRKVVAQKPKPRTRRARGFRVAIKLGR